jgi:phage terminase large subunit
VKLEINKSHKDFFFDHDRWVVSYGGAGSAKSYSTAQKIITRILTEEDHRFLITRKVARTLRVSVFQLFKDIISNIGLYEQFTINKTDMTITNKQNNSSLLFFGLDDIEKLKSIQGITSIWIEEASECDKGDILELNRRLRGHSKYYKQIILTFNPINHLHWLKEHFFDNPSSTASIYKTTYLDNSFIDEEYKKEIEDIKNYDEQQYRVYALGEWGIVNNNIIHHRFKPLEHISDKTIREFAELHIGIDYNIGGSVGVVLAEDKDGIAHIVEEFVVYDTIAMIDELKQRYSRYTISLYPDASGSNRSTSSTDSDIKMLRQAGFKCVVPKSNGSTQTRYNACNRKFISNTLLVNPKTAKRTYESLQVHCYDDKGNPDKFHEHKGGAIDDYTDAFGYVVGRMFPISVGTRITTQILT